MNTIAAKTNRKILIIRIKNISKVKADSPPISQARLDTNGAVTGFHSNNVRVRPLEGSA